MRTPGPAAAVLLPFLAWLAVPAAARLSQPAAGDRPATLDDLRARVQDVLSDTGVPGAGIALVQADGVEWAGGIGLADRARGVPVTADTHFRAGSISKTFVAMALVQLAQDGLLDLDATLAEVVPEVEVDNPFAPDVPVRVIHLLQHTAGFDDMHFREVYAADDTPDLPLARVLARAPASRTVRWRPGSRSARSNSGYGVAGYILEKLSGQAFEDAIDARIFEPLGMTTSSFRLTPDDERLLAQGYAGPDGDPVGFPAIYLRPAGNLHTSAAELARFVRMLLNWGEHDGTLVIDPEYLSNMELPRTTVASRAGLRNGYGSGIFHFLNLPYPMLGHNGGIDGFVSTYAYSPARDAGFVVLLNSGAGGPALRRISGMITEYLKRGVEPPTPVPTVAVEPDALRAYAGYYHAANPRNQITGAAGWLTAGMTIAAQAGTLTGDPVMGTSTTLVPVGNGLFRQESDRDATRVFARDADGRAVMIATVTGGERYSVRRARWTVELVRVPVLLSLGLLLTPAAAGVLWAARARQARPRGFWGLKATLAAMPLALLAPAAALSVTPVAHLGSPGVGPAVIFAATIALPSLAVGALLLAAAARRDGASPWLAGYAASLGVSGLVLTAFLFSWDLIGLRTWTY